MMRTRHYRAAAWALALFACGGGSSGKGEIAGKLIALEGRVFSADSGKALSGADVIDSDGKKARTDANGRFALERTKQASEVSIEHDDYAPSEKQAPATSAYLEVFVKQVDDQKQFAPDKDAQLGRDKAVTVGIPAKSLTREDGKAIKGQVTGRLSAVDPKKPLELSALPGEGRASDGAKKGRISVAGAVNVVLTDADGAKVNVAKGKALDVEFPAHESDKAKVDLFTFDEAKGEWSKQGSATRESKSDGSSVYHAQVPHLSWWAVGELIDQLTCVRGCVKAHDNSAAASARVTVVGIDYTVVLGAYAGDDGCFALDVKAGGQIAVNAVTDSGASDTGAFTAGTTLMSAEDDAHACEDLGTFTIGHSASSDCAAGLTPCGSVCADTARDYANCGACGMSCDAGLYCIARSCAASAPAPSAGLDGGGVDYTGIDQKKDVTTLTLAEAQTLCEEFMKITADTTCEESAAEDAHTPADCEQRLAAGCSSNNRSCTGADVQRSLHDKCAGSGVTVGTFESCVFGEYVPWVHTLSCATAGSTSSPACMQKLTNVQCPGLFQNGCQTDSDCNGGSCVSGMCQSSGGGSSCSAGQIATVPAGTLNADGDPSDWGRAGIQPLITHGQGLGNPSFNGDDIRAVYVASDGSSLFARLELWTAANPGFDNGQASEAPNGGRYNVNFSNARDGSHSFDFGIATENGVWTQCGNGSCDNLSNLRGSQYVGVQGTTIEVWAPLTQLPAIGSPWNVSASICTSCGSNTLPDLDSTSCAVVPAATPSTSGGSGGSDAGAGPIVDAGVAGRDASTACNNVADTAPTISTSQLSGSLPQPLGGTILDGTYYLVADDFYPGSSFKPQTEAQTLVTTGSSWQAALDQNQQASALSAQVTTSGTQIAGQFTCTPSGSTIVWPWTGYTATSTQLVLISTTINEVQTWAKQ